MSRWTCMTCSKSLSSKRSYMEHLNTHNDLRPFTCDHCEYAAASQMTLRRHKLRNHVPRNHWGYSCPHCIEIFMEPASYQTHVSSRHPGLSATFGCSYCQFTTKSSKHFREHIAKHFHVVARHSGSQPVDSLTMNIAEYLIDDENGRGYNVDYSIKDQNGDYLSSAILYEDDYKSSLELRSTKPQVIDRRINSSTQPTSGSIRVKPTRTSVSVYTNSKRLRSLPPEEYVIEDDEAFNSHDYEIENQLMAQFECSNGRWIEDGDDVHDQIKPLPPLRSEFQDIDLD
ncbi:hypothetical protein M3Y98_00513500 [Aphelenchoides besseyi]|nr:hypothetical protein M3Y98_00513500 [Aphelenchoides besseyi]KAI6207874.1 hypothetical protein M3Y96_00055200 [Aphelenchoides besseyi]